MAVVAGRFDVYLVNLDPTVGSEIEKRRPCVVISPDEMNRHIATAVIAPITTTGHAYPRRVPCLFEDREGQVVLDQIRTVDKARLVKRLGRLETAEQQQVLRVLAEMFAP